MTLALRRSSEVAEFLALAADFLAAREAEHNLLFGLCATITHHPEVYPDCRFVVGVDGDRVVAAALQTVPQNVILSVMEPAVAGAIAELLAEDAVVVPGVSGEPEAARAFVARWTACTGRVGALDMRQGVFRLERVIAPRPVAGSWRIVEERDRALLQDWAWAFSSEVHTGAVRRDEVADRWIRRIGRTMYLWEDAGSPVSMAGAGGETPRGTRIGIVYTPPEARGRGYASNLVAAVSQAQLDAGRTFCFLFTDRANPTSNKIYQAIGYDPVTDIELYRFA
jgi:predicted GNAT family acetyltransferase